MASFASTVARAGVLPGDTQASQTEFISAKLPMSVSQILVERSFDLSVPAALRSASILLQHLPRLSGGRLRRIVGDLPGEIDGVAVDDGLAHARAGLVTLDGHASLLGLRLRRREIARTREAVYGGALAGTEDREPSGSRPRALRAFPANLVGCRA